MNILEKLRTPADLKQVSRDQLPELAGEIRRKILDTVVRTGGHLGSGMGVVELTIALHYLYDFGHDRIFFDTGHQCYPHKLLTGRVDRFQTLRTFGGISGFPNIDESPYDEMTSGHAGTALSMGLGACHGDALSGSDRRTVVVVGDASIVSGMSFEALNCAGHTDENMLVVLNANEQSIGKTTGAFARMLSKVRMSKLYLGAKESVAKLERLLSQIPVIGERMDKGVHEVFDHVKHAFVPGQLFEELGFRYFGIYDGHDLDTLLDVIGRIQDQPGIKLLHVHTVKGKGVEGCEEDPLALHGAKPGDSFTLSGDERCLIEKVEPAAKSAAKATAVVKKVDFAKCFAQVLHEEGERRPEVVAITAGMPDGTGLVPFREAFPDRFHNVGIAEQHAVGFASGLTRGGARPVVAIYSTFLQRGFDQVFQEVALQRAPVVMVMSHGGFAGEDGATHHGLFDIPILRTLPGIVLMAPRDGAELQAMFRFALEQNAPVALRYPKASTPVPDRRVTPIQLGRAEVLCEGEDVALVTYGAMAEVAERAADLLAEEGIRPTRVDLRFARPLDEACLAKVLAGHRLVVTVEEGAVAGGVGSAILELASRLDDVRARVHLMGVPDRFIEHGSRAQLLTMLGLTPEGVRDAVLQQSRETAQLRTAP